MGLYRKAIITAACITAAAYLVYFFSRSLQLTIFRQKQEYHQQPKLTTFRYLSKASRIEQVLQDYLRSNSSSVTPIIHQSWKTHLLPTNRSKRWSATWKSCFPDWEWKLWSDEENLQLIRDHYPWFLPHYQSFPNPVERADISRYFYMFHYGGIYTDLDNVCVRKFHHLLTNYSLIFGGMDGVMDGDAVLHTYVQNSFMASRPRHPFWMRLIARIMLYQHLGRSGRAEFITGPFALMDELKDYLSNAEQRDLVIYASKYFNPFSWFSNKIPVCKNLGDMTDEEERACIASHPRAYVVQFHTQSWLAGHM